MKNAGDGTGKASAMEVFSFVGLSAAPRQGWSGGLWLSSNVALGLLFSLLLAFLAKLLIESRMHEEELETLVMQRTADILASKNQLAAMLEAIPDPMWELGLDGRCHGCHSWRVESLATLMLEMIGHTVCETFPPAAADTIMAALSEAHANGSSHGREIELRLAHERLRFELSVASKASQPGEQDRFIVLARDITERNRIEADLLAAKVDAENANQAKSRFLAAASHDLRQPIHALGLFVAQLNNRLTDPETRHLAGRVEAAVMSLQGLLDALLDISRLDAGVVTSSLSALPVNRILDRIETAFAPEATERNLRFRIVRSRLAVTSDPILLERILVNLVANAIRYTRQGGILIGCRRRGAHVRIEVWDTGIGITPEDQEMIFQEFYQVSNPERDRGKGLGLGLAIAERLARLLGGRIDVRSIPGRGSVFAIQLPRIDAPAALIPAKTDLALNGTLRNAVVLVVEDDQLARDAIEGLLRQWGCAVIAARTGDDALAALAREGDAPAALLCDYRLPQGETGIAVIARLRDRIGSPVPAALITGDMAPELLREASDLGLPLLHKPLQPARLRALLEFLVAADVTRPSPGG